MITPGSILLNLLFATKLPLFFQRRPVGDFSLLYQLVIESLKKSSGKNLHLVLLIISR